MLAGCLAYLHAHREQYLADLQALVRIPSISSVSGYAAEMRLAAEAAAGLLRRAGLAHVAVMETAGHPLVYAEHLAAGPQHPTVLFYGHYDVQPALDLEAWNSDPFELLVAGENAYGRGASDMKGQFLAEIFAVEALLQTYSMPPVNIKFLIEGEEEIGSKSLRAFIQAHRDLLRCDVVFNPDAGMVAPDLPAITYALRGGMRADVTIYGPKHDLHSGTFGGTVLNPAQALSKLIAGLHDEQGRVTLPSFYDRVRPLEPDERAGLARLPLNETFFLQETGVPELWGEPDFTPFERTTARPTLEVLSFHAGLPGEGQLNIVPARATAAISTRLVPDQDPQETYELLLQYFETHTPPGVRCEMHYVVGGRPALTERSSPAVQALRRAQLETWGVEPVFVRMGGGIPVVSMLKEELNVDSLLTGFGLMDDNIHGPNEKLHLPTWYSGMEATVRFMVTYA